MQVTAPSSVAGLGQALSESSIVITIPDIPVVPPVSLGLMADEFARYMNEADYRKHRRNELNSLRKRQPLQLIGYLGALDAKLATSGKHRRFYRNEVIVLFVEKPALAKEFWTWLPHLYSVPSRSAVHKRQYAEQFGYRQWYRGQLLRIRKQNPAAFSLILAKMAKDLKGDPRLRKTARLRDAAKLREAMLADLADMRLVGYKNLAAILHRKLINLVVVPQEGSATAQEGEMAVVGEFIEEEVSTTLDVFDSSDIPEEYLSYEEPIEEKKKKKKKKDIEDDEPTFPKWVLPAVAGTTLLVVGLLVVRK